MVEAREVAELLGGRSVLGKPVRNFSDLASAISEGLPGGVMLALASKGASTAKELSESVRIPPRSLARMRSHKRLSADAGDKIYRLAFIVALANKIFGNPDKAHAWLRRANRALGGATPLSAIGTEPGLRQVERELGRIEYGEIG